MLKAAPGMAHVRSGVRSRRLRTRETGTAREQRALPGVSRPDDSLGVVRVFHGIRCGALFPSGAIAITIVSSHPDRKQGSRNRGRVQFKGMPLRRILRSVACTSTPSKAGPYRRSVIRNNKLNALLWVSSIVPPMASQPIRHASS